ncbi:MULTISPECIES: DUF4437 domain-containing protein [unclassified Roseitalea]|uniref:DUF4437 domain-containing protein n=1 Tax=unclassified Roseitalea TaxID=2639107 RepID=UPI00273EE0D1|nr:MULTISPECIES: DUF4437 domain-containing protein [unclassified Roseitalea]
MARPRIEFVQSQHLPWTAAPVAGVRRGAQARLLSADPDTGACSLVVRYPAGWQAPAGQTLACDEELLVLDGSLAVGAREHGYLGYAHLPAGYERGAMAAPEGAIVVTFFSATPAPADGAATADPARTVEALDAMRMPYTGNFHPEFPPGAGRRMLFEDPVTKEQTWILGTLGLRWAERAERHPVVEEMFLIAGEVHGNLGVMRPGAYFWRPPHVPHGPYGSLTGNIYLFRTRGGPLSTEYEDAPEPFHWWPGHRPVLPEDLAGFGQPIAGATLPW